MLSDDFFNVFPGLTRAYGKFTITQTKGVKLDGFGNTIREPYTKDLWKLHLEGKIGLGVVPIKTNPIYSTAKSGVIQITRYLAIEWGPFNVRVNSISPGWIATEMLIEYQKSGKSADPNSVTRSVPLGRFGKPEEIADTVAFLASGKSAFTTGANYVVDGGMIAGIRLASLINGKVEIL